MTARTHNVEEERDLAGRLAGVLFLTAGVSALVLLLVPGVEHGHRDWVIALAAGCIAWGLFCLTLARPDEHGAWFWHAPAVGSIVLRGRRDGLHGRRRLARRASTCSSCWSTRLTSTSATTLFRTCSSCVPVALLPLFYDSGAVEEGYIGELIVVCPAYVVLGLLIIKGKELLVSLRERAEALALLDPLTELPNRRAMVDWLAAETPARVAHRAAPGGPRRLQGREHRPRLSGGRRGAAAIPPLGCNARSVPTTLWRGSAATSSRSWQRRPRRRRCVILQSGRCPRCAASSTRTSRSAPASAG